VSGRERTAAGTRPPRMPARRQRVLALLVGCLLLGAFAAVADARPGGGHSYSGGGYSGGGGGYSGGGGGYSGGGGSYSGGGGSYSGGDGAGLAILIGIGIMILLVAAAVQEGGHQSYTSTPSPPMPPPELDLSAVTRADADFSRVAFEDFVYQLYAAAQRARHDRAALAALTPYLAGRVLDVLTRRATRVDHVVIGNLRIVSVRSDGDPHMLRIVVAIEANLGGAAGTTNVSERWTLSRAANVKTRPPEQTRTLACPSCNAPFTASTDPRTCAHCETAIEVGRFDWTVTEMTVDAETSVGHTLTGTVEEIGNDFPTLVEPRAYPLLMALREDDPNVTWDAFRSRVTMIHGRLGDAWNAQDLAPVRGLVTSSLLQYLQFWIDEYKRQRLGNRLDDARIQHVALAKITRDKWFDAITVRVYADGLDYTRDANGAIVGGSRTRRRAYTEYWTLLRSSARRGPITTTPSCSNCGAPLAISDVGACTHCSAIIENASFDWTLSKIEQDDVYRG
jgi:predicted lipid-binding transport protein (Tim44 family)